MVYSNHLAKVAAKKSVRESELSGYFVTILYISSFQSAALVERQTEKGGRREGGAHSRLLQTEQRGVISIILGWREDVLKGDFSRRINSNARRTKQIQDFFFSSLH